MIARDGATTSLWQATSAPYKTKNAQLLPNDVDVIIVGGGITGISTGLLLQEAGKKCMILEATELCFGTTGGTTAHLNTLLDTPYSSIIQNFGMESANLIAQSAGDAIALIKANIEKYTISCDFEECHAYLFSQDEKQTEQLSAIYDANDLVNVPCQYTDQIPLPIAFAEAIVVSQQAKFHPVRYVHGLANAFENAGGIIKTNCRVTKFSESSEGVDVDCELGLLHCSKFILATHIPPFINILHLRCAPYRTYAIAVRLKDDEYPEDLVYDMYDPYHYYRAQVVDGKKYLIVGGEDHKTAHESNTQACFLRLESHARKYFEIDSIQHAWSSQYYESADGIPYIGNLPGHSENVMVATGFGGNGMIYSSVAATVFKSMVFGEENKLIDVFKPSRVKLIAGFKNFTDHNLDVLKHLVTRLFARDEFHGLADLAPGESKIIKIETQTIGIHKDDQGALHAVNAACTHMKCTVAWNLAEKSWDCPCHGARFSCDGRVLNGPASRDLEYVNIELVSSEILASS
jgi:glycine/D-amino acid oxidase-like deaminating enzyme/nitrite reductase/ring-hydroxylating ferredoxin subunit